MCKKNSPEQIYKNACDVNLKSIECKTTVCFLTGVAYYMKVEFLWIFRTHLYFYS